MNAHYPSQADSPFPRISESISETLRNAERACRSNDIRLVITPIAEHLIESAIAASAFEGLLWIQHEWSEDWRSGWVDRCVLKLEQQWFEVDVRRSCGDDYLSNPKVVLLLNAIGIRLDSREVLDSYQSSMAFSTSEFGFRC